MGILGLTSFIDENPHLLEDFKLFNTRLVIDGNNLYHFLYYYYNVGVRHGGDYDTFGECVRSYFQKLISCSIEAHVVFDGAYNSDDKKLKTCLKRAKDRIMLAKLIASGERAKILPILAYETFRNILDELSVKHVTCDYEADSQLTALANEFNCPVVSNDSDFFVYDIKGGFILLDYINLRLNTEEDSIGNKFNYLKVQMYNLDTLLSHFPNLNREIIPLFASILGNDYIPREEFESFFAKANLPKPNKKQFFSTPKRHCKFIKLLLWLEHEESLEGAIESTMKYIHETKRKKVRQLLMKSICEYRNPQTILMHYLTGDKTEIKVESLLRSACGNLLPDWFVSRVRMGLIPAMCLNVIVSRRVILLSQVECINEVSAYTCSQKLRKIIYSILLSLDIQEDTERIQDGGNTVDEYSRQNSDLKKSTVFINGDIQIPSLFEIPKLSVNVRLNYILAFLSVSEDDYIQCRSDLTEEHLLPIFAMFYCIDNANPQLTDVYVKCLALCFIYKWLQLLNKEGAVDQDHGLKLSDVNKAVQSLNKFGELSKSIRLDSSIIHAFAQYQTCLQGVIYLNQLLLCPLKNPNPATLICGTFLYNTFVELRNRKCPDLYIEEMLGRSSTVLVYFKQLLRYIMTSISCTENLATCTPGKKNIKKKKKKLQQSSTSVCASVEDEHDVEIVQEETYRDLNNKFSALMMADQI